MENQLKCVLVLSLKEIAVRRVTILLCSNYDIFASILKFLMLQFHDYRSREWREAIKDKVKDEVFKLKLPESLRKQVIDYVYPISLEIRRWIEIHKPFFSSSLDEIYPAKLCWTTAGEINYRNTAEEHLRCDAYYVLEPYKLACYYCLEDYILPLWEKLPEKMKKYYYVKKQEFLGLEFCWPYILKGELSKLDYLLVAEDRNMTSFNQWAFEHTAREGNRSATEYFFQKLTHRERGASLKRTTLAVLENLGMEDFFSTKLSDVSHYFLSLMTPEQQMEVVVADPINVLLCFLDWPLHDIFSANAGLIWTRLPSSDFDELIWEFHGRFRVSYHYFPKVFQEFFMQSSLDFKKYFGACTFPFNSVMDPTCDFLSAFIDFEDSESIVIMFKNMLAADRVELIFRRLVLKLLHDCICNNQRRMVEVCLREAGLSKEDRERLKESFMGIFKRNVIAQIDRENEWYVNQEFKRVFGYLDETDASSDTGKKGQKRKLEDCSPE